MKPTEQLAVLTALKKAVDDRIKDIREVCNEELLDDYEEDGVLKKALKVGGVKVGDFVVTMSKEGYVITDKEALNEFALDYGFASFYSEIDPEHMDDAISFVSSKHPDWVKLKIRLSDGWERGITYIDGECCYMDSGMIIPGIEYVPPKVKGTMVRGCKPEDVIPITRRLGGVDQLLLED